MNKMLESVHLERSLLRAHYEETLHATLAHLWRRKLVILVTVTAALALGILATLLLPKSYTAEAYVNGGFAPPDAGTGGRNSNVNIDASLLVETRARLLRSHHLARRVVDRFGHEQLRSELGDGFISSSLHVLFGGHGTTPPGYQEDTAAVRLLRGLSVKTEPRLYLIMVRYTAANPELAARIANAFVAEFMQMIALQTLSEHRETAQAALSEQIAIFGDKHPNVVRAKARLAALDALFEAQTRKTAAEVARMANENVTLAQAIAVPSSPNPRLCIGLALLFGVVAGIALALFGLRAALPGSNSLTWPVPSPQEERVLSGRGRDCV